MPPDLNDLAMAIGYLVMGSTGLMTALFLAWAVFEYACKKYGIIALMYRLARENRRYRDAERGA